MAATLASFALLGKRVMAPIRPSSSCWAANSCWTKSARSVLKPAPRKRKRPARRWKSRKPTSRLKLRLKANRKKKKRKSKVRLVCYGSDIPCPTFFFNFALISATVRFIVENYFDLLPSSSFGKFPLVQCLFCSSLEHGKAACVVQL